MSVYGGNILYGYDDRFKALRQHALHVISDDLHKPHEAWPNIVRIRQLMKEYSWIKMIKECLGQEARISSPVLRCSVPNQHLAHAHSIHRDTWYGYPAHTINVWIPIFGHTQDNGMHIYPQFFQQAVLNNSEQFDATDWKHNHNAVFPVCLDDLTNATKVSLYKPDCFYYMFSSQHLHATTPNTSVARWSLDFRFVVDGHENHGPTLSDNLSKPLIDEFC